MTLAFAATLAFSLTTIGWSAVSVAPTLNGSSIRLVNDPCFHKGQKRIRAVNVATHQTVLDINGDALLILASTTELVTSATALLRLSPHYRFRTAFLSTVSVRHRVLRGDFYLKRHSVRTAWRGDRRAMHIFSPDRLELADECTRSV